MKSNKNFRKDDLSPESNTKKIYKMYKRKKQWVVAPVVFGLLLHAFSPVAALAVTDTEQANAETAQMRVVDDEELQKLINQAVTNIEALKSLSPEAKDVHLANVRKATNEVEVNTATVDAYKADVVAEIDLLQASYDNQIEALNSLPETGESTKAAYKGKIATALAKTGLINKFNAELANESKNYGVAKEVFAADLAENQKAAEEVLKAATEANTAFANLPKYKAQQKEAIKGMTYFSDLEKELHYTAIDNAETKEEVDSAVDAAKTAYQGVLTKLINAQVNALSSKLQEADLSATLDDAFSDRLEKIANKTPRAEQDLVDLTNLEADIDQAIANKETADLNEKKANMKNQIASEAGDVVKAEDVKRFQGKVDAAKTTEALDAVMQEWNEFYEVESLKQKNLAAAQAEAQTLLDALELEDKIALSTYKANVGLSKTAEAVAEIVAQAQAARKLEIKALEVAKETAIKEIQALSNLKADEKEPHITAVKAATTKSEVNTKLELAKDADKAAQLSKAKLDAKKQIDSLEALDETERTTHKAKLDVDTVDTLEKVADILAKAVYANDIKAIETAELDEAKEIAKNILNKLEDLTVTQAKAALKSITDAKNNEEIKTALETAEALNATNKATKDKANELAEAKIAANKQIDELKYLSKSVKDGYKAEINAKTTIDDITDVVNRAMAADTNLANKQEQLLMDKEALAGFINGASELTDAEKKKFSSEVVDCSTTEEVATLKGKVEQLITDRQVAAADLNAAQTTINNAINGLIGLTPAQKVAYTNKVNSLSEKADMVAVYEEAKAEAIKQYDKELTNEIDSLIDSGSYVEAQKMINQLKSDTTRKQYQTKLNNGIALSEAKAAANKQIDALENLTAEEKVAAKDKISKLTTKAAVEKEVEALVKADNLVHDKPLIELAEAQIKAKDFDKAAETIKKIRDADTKAKLQKQLEDAQKVAPNIRGTGHVSNIGWQKTVDTNEIIGTTGRKLALEAVKLNLEDVDMPESAKKIEGGIEYRAHVRNIGWQGYKANGELAGTTGKALRMEAIQIRLTGELAKRYDVQYRAHSKNKGWGAYVSNGATAGTTGKALRMEAVQIRLVEKK